MQGLHYQLVNAEKEKVFCNLKEGYKKLQSSVTNKSQKIPNSKIRAGFIECEYGSVYVFTENDDFFKSSKKFILASEVIVSTFKMITEQIQSAKERHNRRTKRLVHNLVSLNAHSIQELYNLFDQDSVSSKKQKELIEYIGNIAKSDPNLLARFLIRIAKNNSAMKAEFSVFEKLFQDSPNVNPKQHDVHKVLMNTLYTFYPDFTERGIRVKVDPEMVSRAYFEYESFSSAIFHLIDNATKYCKANSNIKITAKTNGGVTVISFDMFSLKIDELEKSEIFSEGYSGIEAIKLNKAGEGIGMNRVAQILLINNGEIDIDIYPGTAEQKLGVVYQRNVFKVSLCANSQTWNEKNN